MTKLTLILTLKDPHDAKPDPKRLLRRVKMLKCCPRLGFEPGMSNVENLKDRANALTPEPLLLSQDYCISTRTLSKTCRYVVSTVHQYLRICGRRRCIRS